MATAQPKPFIFVLMPFASDFDDIYEFGIKPACEAAGGQCERVDEQIYQETTLQRIYGQIESADLIVADMTNKNPNVFYEVGYAHSRGKIVILLTQHSGDIPFDLKHYPHIVYEGKLSKLRGDLEKYVSHWLRQSSSQARKNADHPTANQNSALGSYRDLEYYIKGQRLADQAKIILDDRYWRFSGYNYVEITVRLDAYNPTNHPVIFDANISVVYPLYYQVSVDTALLDAFHTPDGKKMSKIPSFRSPVSPNEWESIIFDITIPDHEVDYMDGNPLTLRFHSELGMDTMDIFLSISQD